MTLKKTMIVVAVAVLLSASFIPFLCEDDGFLSGDSGVIEIDSIEDLMKIGTEYPADGHYVLTADIDLTDAPQIGDRIGANFSISTPEGEAYFHVEITGMTAPDVPYAYYAGETKPPADIFSFRYDTQTSEQVLNVVGQFQGKTVGFSLRIPHGLDTGYEPDPIGFGSGNFVPIEAAFSGTFDGNGHKIKNMQIVSEGNAGLFSNVNNGAVIKNLWLDGGYSISLNGAAGSFAGSMGTSNGTVSILNCKSDMDMYSYGSVAGGIMGVKKYNSNPTFVSIQNCMNTGYVVSSGSVAGGILGSVQGTMGMGVAIELRINNCINTGNVCGNTSTGGIVGGFAIEVSGDAIEAYINDTYTTGSITKGLSGTSDPCAIAGLTTISTGINPKLYIENTFALSGTVSKFVDDTKTTVSTINSDFKNDSALKTKTTFDGWDFDTGLNWTFKDGSYPILSTLSKSSADNVTAVCGTEATVSHGVVVNWGDTATYKWEKQNGLSWGELTGQTENELSITDVSASDIGTYRCTVTTLNGHTVISDAVTLNVTFTVTADDAAEGWTLLVQTPSDGVIQYDGTCKFKIGLLEAYDESTGYNVYMEGDLDPLTADPDGVYTISNITDNIVITMDGVVKNTYDVILTPGDGYSLNSTDTSPVEYDGDFTFEFVLNSRYSESDPIVKVNGNEITLTAENKYTILNIKENQTVTVEGISVNKYDIIFSSGEGYILAPAEGYSSPVVDSESFVFTLTLSAGYDNSTPIVKVNDVDLAPGADGTYSIMYVLSEQTVTVEGIVKNTYSIMINQGQNGTVSSSATTVNHGDSVTLTMTADDGYRLSVLKVNGETVTNDVVNGEYTMTVTEDCVVDAEFAVKGSTGGGATDEYRVFIGLCIAMLIIFIAALIASREDDE